MPESLRPPLAAVLVTTCARYEHLADPIVATLARRWPAHPRVVVVTDRGAIAHADRIVVATPRFTEMLRLAIGSLLASGALGESDLVVLLLEDHVPLGPVDDGALRRLADEMATAGGDVTNLCGHGRPDPGPDGEVAPQDPSFRWPKSVHPSLWRAGFLAASLEEACRSGIGDIWAFERLAEPRGRVLVTTRFRWPSPPGGFLEKGAVRFRSLPLVLRGGSPGLAVRVAWQALGELPAKLRQVARRELGRGGAPA